MGETLTLQQQMAVDNRGGKLLVSAAAGSGKTKVLVDRLLKYVTDPADPANIDDFLIITFTEAAAAELRGKIAAKLSEHIAADPANRHLQRQLQRLYLAKISTVHAFCSGILREYAYRLDLPADFRVADENECMTLQTKAMETVLEEAYERIGSDHDLQSFFDMQGLGRNDSIVPQILMKVYNSAQCHLSPEKWLRECVDSTVVDGYADAGQTVWGKYLMDTFFAWLDDQIAAMSRCADAVAAIPSQEKAVAVLAENVQVLRALRSCSCWDEIVKLRDFDFGSLRFQKKTDDPSVSEPVKAVRKACKSELEKRLRWFCDPSCDILADLGMITASAKGMVDLVVRFSKEYTRRKRMRRILDFNDLEHMVLKLLLRDSTPTAVAREIGERFREIMVDEYQDTNAVQDAIYTALTHEKQNLFMVGDVKQSIYQFRLADPEIFLEKYAQYVPAEEAKNRQGRKVLLSKNFRSGGGVISAVNDIFRDCMTRDVGGLAYGADEMLYEGVPHVSLNEPEVELHAIVTNGETSEEEADFVAEKVVELLDGNHFVRNGDQLRPIQPEDIAIILRAPNTVGSDFQHALEIRGIRTTTGAGGDLLQTEECGTLYAILQIISNPRQDIPLIAAMASPVFGFTADELAFIRANSPGGCIYDAVTRMDTPKCHSFLDTVSALRSAAGMRTLPELMERIFNLTRMDSVYAAMPDGDSRSANLRAIYKLATDYCASGFGDLDRFLEYLQILSEQKKLAVPDTGSAGCVTIISIHKSKGLEYPVVFVSGLSRKFNKLSQQGHVLCDKELGLGLNCVDIKNRIRYSSVTKYAIAAKIGKDNLSEEMRLLYVALTRARDRLIMTYASNHLEKDIRDLALSMDLCSAEMMSKQAQCPGDWILYSALRRTEAGELFAVGDRPSETFLREPLWNIQVHADTADLTVAPENEEAVDNSLTEGDLQELSMALSFRYPHLEATRAPSKVTATQKKGRIKDQEVSENSDEPKPVIRSWRKPGFVSEKLKGKDYGNAVHTLMQYISFADCDCVEAVQRQICDLKDRKLLLPEEAEAVDPQIIAEFFRTDLGRKLSRAEHVCREFKFSILEDGHEYLPGLTDEKILLQGVVDCAILEPDGITIIDFKTDRVTEDTLAETVAHYRAQVEAYARAMSRIYQLPIKQKVLYFFRLSKLVCL